VNYNTVRRVTRAGVFCMLLTGSASLGFSQVSMELTGVGNGYTMGGVYVSPYQGSVCSGLNQASCTSTSSNVLYSGYMICDDFSTDSHLGLPTWNASVTASASSIGGSVKFASDSNAYYSTTTAQQNYNAVAYLASQLMMPANMNNQTNADEYSFAIWSIFDKAALGYVTSVGTKTQGTVTLDVQNLIANAFTATASGYTGPTVTVYSPNPSGVSQEFLVVNTPEPPAPALLAFEVGGPLGMLLLFRKQLLRTRLQN